MSSSDSLVQMVRRNLTAALLSDALDECGLMHQIMDRAIRPVDERQVLCGRARTGRLDSMELDAVMEGSTDYGDAKPDVHEALIELVDSLRTDDVMVITCGPYRQLQAWGDLLALDAAQRGVAGCVTDGMMRDVARIRQVGLPAFCVNHSAVDTRGRLVATDVPLQCGGVWVSPGDLVFGDVDGVVVVPREAEAEVVRIALEQAALDRKCLRALREGVSMTEAYRRFGVF